MKSNLFYMNYLYYFYDKQFNYKILKKYFHVKIYYKIMN